MPFSSSASGACATRPCPTPKSLISPWSGESVYSLSVRMMSWLAASCLSGERRRPARLIRCDGFSFVCLALMVTNSSTTWSGVRRSKITAGTCTSSACPAAISWWSASRRCWPSRARSTPSSAGISSTPSTRGELVGVNSRRRSPTSRSTSRAPRMAWYRKTPNWWSRTAGTVIMLYASSLRRAQQERLPRRILGGLLAADGHQLAAQPLEAALGRPVRLRCVGQVLAPQPEVLLQAIEVAAKTRQQPHHLLGARLDPDPAQPERDRLQVGVEAVGRHRDDLAVEAVGGETGLLVADDGLVVDVLGRDVHEREVVGALVGEHVLGRDVVDVPPYPGSERPARARALVVVRGLEQTPEVLERELGVDGDEPAAQADDRIDPLAAPEGVLEGEVGGG